MSEGMTFGVKADQDVVSGDGDWIRYINKNGEYTFRFLEDWPQWTSYWEHFSQDKKMAYPCTGDKKNCPGCNVDDERESKASKRLLVNAVLLTGDGQGYANLWRFAGGLRADLERLRSKSSRTTLTDRPYTITRYEGSNGFISYAIDREDPEPFDASQYQLRDHQQALMEAYQAANDPARTAQVQAEREAYKEARQAEQAASNGHSEGPKEPDLSGLNEFRPKPEGEEEAPQQEPVKKSRLRVVEEEPELTLSPSQIRRMSMSELLNLYTQAGFSYDEGTDHKVLADNLIRQLTQPS